MKKIIISVLLVNLLAACASQKPKEPVAEAKPAPAAATATATAAAAPAAKPAVREVKPVAPVAAAALDPLNDSKNLLLAKRSVYHDYDNAAVKDADRPVVEAHAKYLSQRATRKVRLEGNCDERGSDEYNLALGQRRADSVKKMLQAGGAKDTQLETVSYGEAKPKALGHDEAAWAENRRTDLIYSGK